MSVKWVVMIMVALAVEMASAADVEQAVPDAHDKQAKQQAEAIAFMKDCVRKVKRRDPAVLKVCADAGVIVNVEDLLRKQNDGEIPWEEQFGRIHELTDAQIDAIDTEVFTLVGTMRTIPVTLTDKRHAEERKVRGVAMSFSIDIAPEFRKVFHDEERMNFGVYLIDGEYYWNPFGW